MANKFKPTGTQTPCQLCGDTSGKCRVSLGDNTFILCMTYSDARVGDKEGHWKCVSNKGNSWAGFKPVETGITDQDWRNWERERRRRTERRKKELVKLRKHSLPIERRVGELEALGRQLDLSEEHLQNLTNRGFSRSLIKSLGFKSIPANYSPNPQLDRRTPGLNASGKFTNRRTGILCPAHDADGRIIGYQIRHFDPAEDSPKYTWLSNKKNPSSIYPEGSEAGEQPLDYAKPENIEGHRVGLVEGIGIKPQLAARKVSYPCIGAAGGNHACSPQQLKTLIEKSKEGKRKPLVTFLPDAGALMNRHVTRQLRNQVALCKELGYKVEFGWWGQITKDCADIDEIEEGTQIEYLSPRQFFGIGNKYRDNLKQQEKDRIKQEERNYQDSLYRELTEITEKPWKEVNQPEIDLVSLLAEEEEPGIYVVISAKGTGKTKALVPLIDRTKPLYAWFSRVALGREECSKLGISYRDEIRGRESSVLQKGFCADSAHLFPPHVLADQGQLIIDEFDQVAEHLFGSTCNKEGKRPLILSVLEAQIKACLQGNGRVLALSADITQKEIDYLKALAPKGTPVKTIINHYQPPKGVAFFDLSKNCDAQIHQLITNLEEGKPSFVICDTKTGTYGCQAIAERIRELHPEWSDKIVEINSDTSGEESIVKYLKNINENSLDTLLLICSPSVISGISLENGRFNSSVFAFLQGVLMDSHASQAISRVRGAENVHIWAASRGILEANGEIEIEKIRDWYKSNYEVNYKHLLSFKPDYEPISQEWNSPHFDLYLKNTAYRNICALDYQQRILKKLTKENYQIKFYVSEDNDDDLKGSLKAASWKVQSEKAMKVAQADILDDARLENLEMQDTPLTPEELNSVQKTWLHKTFGEKIIEQTIYTYEDDTKVEILMGYAAMFLKNQRGQYKSKLDSFYQLHAPLEEVANLDLAIEGKQRRHNKGVFIPDLRWNTRKKKCREYLDIKKYLQPNKPYSPIDYAELTLQCRRHAKLIKEVLNFNTEKVCDSQIFVELLSQLGIETETSWAKTKAGKRYRVRSITEDSLRFAQMYIEHRQQQLAELKEAELEKQESVTVEESLAERSDHTPPSISNESLALQSTIFEPQTLNTNKLQSQVLAKIKNLETVDVTVNSKAVLAEIIRGLKEAAENNVFGLVRSLAQGFGTEILKKLAPEIQKLGSSIDSIHNLYEMIDMLEEF